MHRTIWLSDVHLGARDAKSQFLLDFLIHNDSKHLYLVGDIIDLWEFRRRSWHWPSINREIIDLVFQKAQKGTEVFYIPGNHDDAFRKFAGQKINGIKVCQQAVHTTADRRRFLVIHGDEFDPVATYSKWLSRLGSYAYGNLLRLNRYFNFFRRKTGGSYWSLSSFLKNKVKEVVKFVGNYKHEIIREAERQQVDGLICGHIHHASYERIGDKIYSNTGDWMESCTALVEGNDGKLTILHWTEELTVLYDEKEYCTSKKVYADCYNNGRLVPTN